MSKSKQGRLTDALRRAIRESGATNYRICADCGIVDSSLLRFMRGDTSLRLDKADALAEYFDLELKPRAKRKGK